MDNKMCYQPMYKCAICDTIHDNIKARMQCEMKCLKQQEEEEKKAAEAQKKAEQAARHEKAEKMLMDAIAELQAYCKDYGYFEPSESDLEFFWPSRLYHYFL